MSKELQYEVLQESYINDKFHKPGEKVHFAGKPGRNLKPLCEEGKARQKAHLESNKAYDMGTTDAALAIVNRFSHADEVAEQQKVEAQAASLAKAVEAIVEKKSKK